MKISSKDISPYGVVYDLHLIKEILMLYKHLVKPFVYTTSYGLLWVIALQLKTIITLLEEVIK